MHSVTGKTSYEIVFRHRFQKTAWVSSTERQILPIQNEDGTTFTEAQVAVDGLEATESSNAATTATIQESQHSMYLLLTLSLSSSTNELSIAMRLPIRDSPTPPPRPRHRQSKNTVKDIPAKNMSGSTTAEIQHPSLSEPSIMSDAAFEAILAYRAPARESTVDHIVRETEEAERNYVEPEEDDWVPSPEGQRIYEEGLAGLKKTNGAAELLWVQEGIGLPSRQPTFAAVPVQQQPSNDERDQEFLQDVRERHIKNREAMSHKYNKKWTVDEFEEGDIVALKIPRAVRTSTDNLRLFCTVVDRPHRNSYELRCRHGLLTRLYATKNLERVPENLAATIEIPLVAKKISLARAAELESTSTRI